MSGPDLEPRSCPHIPAAIARAAQRYGDEPAVVDEGLNLSYTQLMTEIRRFSAALVASGAQKGDRVAIWAPNSAQWIIALLGSVNAGAIAVPVNTRFRAPEAAAILAESGARVLVTVRHFLGTDYVHMLRSGDADLPDLETIVAADQAGSGDAAGWDEFLGRAQSAGLREVDQRIASARAADVADILYTSGTTGRPKGVVSTHARSLSVAAEWIDMTGLHRGDRYLQVNPYFNLFGLQCGVLTSILAGATLLPEARFDVERALEKVEREKVTIFPGPPTMYQSILDHPGKSTYDLSSLRVALTGASDIPVELIQRIHNELPFSRVISAYGMTELGTVCSTEPGDTVKTIATTVGRPRPGVELRIVGSDGTDVQPGSSGELLVRGDRVMSGYFENPAATADVFTSDGWLRTGDVGFYDENSHLKIVGRIKDMFIVGGFNVYPAEIELALIRHPEVQDAAAIGIPDERLGEVGMAFVVAAENSQITPDEIIAWSREQLANYKVPRQVAIVGKLPRNATGKVQKQELKLLAAEYAPDSQSA